MSIDYSDATPDVAFTYDRLGRQLTVTDVLGTRTNVYSPTDLLEERHPDGTALGPDYAVGYGYDAFDRFSTVAVSNGPTFTYSYVPDSSLLAGYTNDLGLAVAYEYEPLRDLKTLVSNAWSTNVISSFAYTYDAIGRRTRRIDDDAVTNLFGYNLRSELVSALMGTNAYSYAYDPIGNRTETVENGLTTTYAANSLNQYTALNPASPTPIPFTYDPDGNMTSDGTWAYAWDAENRLIEVQPLVTNLDSTLIQYMYDAQSRRIARREFSWNDYLGETTWHYVQGRAYRYDDWNLLQERKPTIVPRTPQPYISQTDLALTGIGGPVAAGYIWGLDLSSSLRDAGGIGGLLMQHHSDYTSPLFSFCDANGNITDLLDEAGTLAAHNEYDSYGNTTVQSGPPPAADSFRFSTKYCENEMSLSYYGYRFFKVELGRWVNRDPIGEHDDGSLYGYVANDPVSQVDPHGLFVLGKIAGECLKGIAKELLMRDLGTRWDKALGCRVLDDIAAVDPDFSVKVCRGLAFDLQLQPTYNGKPIGQVLLECVTAGIIKKGLNQVLNSATDPIDRKLVNALIEHSVDGSVSGAMGKVEFEGKIRLYSFCRGKTLYNLLNYRTVVTYEGVSVATTALSEPFECVNKFAFPQVYRCGACLACPEK